MNKSFTWLINTPARYSKIIENSQILDTEMGRPDDSIVGVAYAILSKRLDNQDRKIIITELPAPLTVDWGAIFDFANSKGTHRSILLVPSLSLNPSLQELNVPADWEQSEMDKRVSDFIGSPVISKGNTTVIFCPMATPEWQEHRIAAAIVKLDVVKDWMNENPITPEEKEALKSLTEDGVVFRQFMEAYEKTLNVNEWLIDKYLKGWIGNPREKRIENLKCQLQVLADDIKRYYEAISSRILQQREKRREYNALLTSRDDGEAIEQEIKDFLKAMPNIRVYDKSGSYLYFQCTGYAMSNDENIDILKAYIENKDAILYYLTSTSDIPYRVLKEFYKSVFIDERWRMRMGHAFTISKDAKVDIYSGFEYIDMMPNPHLYHYSCWGDHYDILLQTYEALDYVGAMQIAYQAAINVNWSDGVVTEAFINDMFERNNRENRIYESSDGTLVSAAEIIDILTQELEAENETN